MAKKKKKRNSLPKLSASPRNIQLLIILAAVFLVTGASVFYYMNNSEAAIAPLSVRFPGKTFTTISEKEYQDIENTEKKETQKEIDLFNSGNLDLAANALSDTEVIGSSGAIEDNYKTEKEAYNFTDPKQIADNLLKGITSLGGNPAEAAGACSFVKSAKYYNSKTYRLLVTSRANTLKQANTIWAYKKYGTAATCTNYKEAGCAPTAIANALHSYKVDDSISTPQGVGEKIAATPSYRNLYTQAAACVSGTNPASLSTIPGYYISDSGLLLTSRKIGWTEANLAIAAGKPVIFKTTNPCFTSGGHYLVIAGRIQNKKTGLIYFLISDSGPRNIRIADKAQILKDSAGYWVIEKTRTRISM